MLRGQLLQQNSKGDESIEMGRPYSPIRKMLPATKSGKTSNSCMNSICKMRDCPGAQTCHANPPAYLTESKDSVIRVDNCFVP